MKRLLTGLLLLLVAANALAIEVSGVTVEPEAEIAGQTLQLNGYGIRKKFIFVKVYVGSLYTAETVADAAAAIAPPGPKLIRMDFLHSRVDNRKIVDAFDEGFRNNTPELVATPAVRQFLALFQDDFVEGDRVDLELLADGSVTARHNGEELGTVRSPDLARGVLLIYLGDLPADEQMKEGMLGK